MDAFRIWDHDADHVQASLDGVYYTFSRGDARPENIDSMVSNLDSFARQRDGKFGYIFHVVAGARPPSSSDRSKTTAMFNKHAARLSGVAIVIEADGFAGAMLRSAAHMVFAMSRKGFDSKTFDSVQSAAEWIAERQRTRAHALLNLVSDAHAVLARTGG